MIGAIIGDIAGSRFEFNNIKTKTFNILYESCFFTDDSVMTIAVGNALLACDGKYQDLEQKVINSMQTLGRKYPDCGFGGMFYHWIFDDQPKPYNSFGNGAGMRVSACGIVGKSLEEVKMLSKIVTGVSHNHPEGLKAAEAVATSVFLARQGKTIDEIKAHIINHYYPLDFTLDGIRDSYEFTEKSQDTIPQALVAFFESKSFEDAIKNAISIGGDSDTIAAITGSIAAEYYGIPKWMTLKARTFLDSELKQSILAFEKVYIPKIIT
ncbi:MAG: ADP-ribosylglycohydrolase family protein [Candidatus Izemoplasmataceae bacterium]